MKYKNLYTVGHSTHTTTKFSELLEKHNISAICDVRSAPYSRMNPQFNKETLQNDLKENGIAYVFLGQELGARSDNPDCYEGAQVQYKLLSREPSFSKGLERVRQGMERYNVALMCAEKDPITCHRTILVCRALRDAPISIMHIKENGDIETNEEAEHRLMDILNIHPDMFQDEETCIRNAYDKQAERIAYVKVIKDQVAVS